MLNFYIAGEFLFTALHRTCDRKKRCNEVMVLAKLYTALHHTCDAKMRCSAIMVLA